MRMTLVPGHCCTLLHTATRNISNRDLMQSDTALVDELFTLCILFCLQQTNYSHPPQVSKIHGALCRATRSKDGAEMIHRAVHKPAGTQSNRGLAQELFIPAREADAHRHLQLPKIAIDSVFARDGKGLGTVY